jgi:drug/metabolite transporter (DMT)-like permease
MPISNFHLFAVCVMIWGSTWLAITYQFGTVAPEMSVGYRFLFASAVLLVFCRIKKISLAFTPAQHAHHAAQGLAMYCVSYIFVYYAETFIVSGMVAVAYSVSPMLNMLAARLFFGTRMTMRVTIGALFGVAGIVCVFWPEFGRLSVSRNAELGALLAVLAVIASTVGSMVATRNQQFKYSTWASMAWGMLYGGIASILFGLASGKSLTFSFETPYLLSLVYLSLLGSIVTFGCFLTLLARVGAARAGYIGVMTPVVALTISYFFEKFAWNTLTSIGVALCVMGNVVILSRTTSTKLAVKAVEP